MTNYEYLTSLPVEKFTNEIINITNSFGGNYQLLLNFLNSTYINPHTTIRDILSNNFNNFRYTFRYRGFIYETTSIDDFIKKYGSVSEPILSSVISGVRVSKSGNGTILLK